MDTSLHALAQALTDFGNLAVAGMAAVAGVATLLLQQRRELAARLGLAVVGVLGATAALKLVSVNLGPSFVGKPWALSIGAPSGHAAIALVSYGGVAMICARRGAGRARILAPLLALALIAAVSVTRVTLHAHTPADVAAGLLVGGAALAWASRRLPGGEQRPLSAAVLAGSAALAALAMHLTGARLNSTDFL